MHIVWIGLVAFLRVLLALSAVAARMLVRLAMDPGSDRSAILAAPHNRFVPEEAQRLKARKEARAQWLKTVSEETWSIVSDDGLTLRAYLYRAQGVAPEDRWAVICHGYGGDAHTMLDQAMHFSKRGYSVLLPDARAHGESEGRLIGMGWPERRDIVGWARTIERQAPGAQIVLYGISMGAATVMMAAGEPLPQSVFAVIEDCGYTSVWDEFAYQLKKLYRLPPFPVLHMASLIVKHRQGWFLQQASAVRQLAKSRLPILLIHGDADTFVPTAMLDVVYAAANPPKERLLVSGAAHGGASETGGAMYWQTVWAFLDAHGPAK